MGSFKVPVYNISACDLASYLDFGQWALVVGKF